MSLTRGHNWPFRCLDWTQVRSFCLALFTDWDCETWLMWPLRLKMQELTQPLLVFLVFSPKKAKLKFDRDLNNIELSYWICQVVAWTCQCCYMWFSPFAKHSQSDVWPRYLSFLIGLKHSIKFKDSMPWVSCAFATFLLKTWVYFLIEQISLLSLGSVCFEGFLCSAPLSPLVVFYGEHIVSIQQGLWISICHPQDSLTLPHWHVHRPFIFLHNLLNGTKDLLSCILSSFFYKV